MIFVHGTNIPAQKRGDIGHRAFFAYAIRFAASESGIFFLYGKTETASYRSVSVFRFFFYSL